MKFFRNKSAIAADDRSASDASLVVVMLIMVILIGAMGLAHFAAVSAASPDTAHVSAHSHS